MITPAIFLDHLIDAARREQRPLDDVLLHARRLGYEGVEISFHPETDPHTLSAQLSRAGLFASTLCVFTDFANHPDDLSLAFTALDHCVILGAKRFLTIPGRIDLEDPIRAQQQRDNIVSALNALCAYTKERGVTIVMEDFDGVDAPYRTIEGVRYFIDRVPGLQIAFDTGNFAFSEEDELEAFDRLKDRIAHVHLKDRALTPGAPDAHPLVTLGGRKLYASPFGSGIIQSEEILRRLKEIGYDGVVTVEHYGAPHPLQYAEASIRWLSARIR